MAIAETLTFDVAAGFPAAAPFFDGHFPGRPIVPGAVLLAEAARRLSDTGLTITAAGRVKFLRAVGPGEPLRIDVRGQGDEAAIEWIGAQGPVARARVSLGPGGG